MKKVLLLLVVVSLVVAFVSCKKDKTDVTYTKSQFVGITWVQTLPALTAGDSAYIKFSDTQYFDTESYAALNLSSNGIDYTFDGKAISTAFGLLKITINELSATKLVVTQTSTIASGSVQFTYKKK